MEGIPGNIRNVHGDTKHGILDTSNIAAEKVALAFESPRLIYAVQVLLPVSPCGLAVAIDDESRIVVLGRCRPFVRDVDLLGIPSNHCAVIFQSNSSCPETTGARARGFEVGEYFVERLEIIACSWCKSSSTWEEQDNDRKCLPVKASSGSTKRSKPSGGSLRRTESARERLLFTSPLTGANWRHPILMLLRIKRGEERIRGIQREAGRGFGATKCGEEDS